MSPVTYYLGLSVSIRNPPFQCFRCGGGGGGLIPPSPDLNCQHCGAARTAEFCRRQAQALVLVEAMFTFANFQQLFCVGLSLLIILREQDTQLPTELAPFARCPLSELEDTFQACSAAFPKS